jgi:hypothetical protein
MEKRSSSAQTVGIHLRAFYRLPNCQIVRSFAHVFSIKVGNLTILLVYEKTVFNGMNNIIAL